MAKDFLRPSIFVDVAVTLYFQLGRITHLLQPMVQVMHWIVCLFVVFTLTVSRYFWYRMKYDDNHQIEFNKMIHRFWISLGKMITFCHCFLPQCWNFISIWFYVVSCVWLGGWEWGFCMWVCVSMFLVHFASVRFRPSFEPTVHTRVSTQTPQLKHTHTHTHTHMVFQPLTNDDYLMKIIEHINFL